MVKKVLLKKGRGNSFLKENKKMILIILVSSVVALFSLSYLIKITGIEPEKYSKVVIAKQDIEVYEIIKESDLEEVVLPVQEINKESAVSISQVIGKVPLYNIKKGSQINLEYVIEKFYVDTERHQVSVNINLNRSVAGTLQPGDLVDVYWLNGEAPPSILAEDSIVLRISDNEGNNLNTSYVNKLNAKKVEVPSTIVLSVKPEEVPNVVKGSANENINVVLVKKFKKNFTNNLLIDNSLINQENKENEIQKPEDIENSEEITNEGTKDFNIDIENEQEVENSDENNINNE